MKATLNKAIKVWGEQSQLIKANEELAELQQAICKWMLKDVEKRHLEVNLLKQGINILSGCGMQSDTKQKHSEALPLGESMTYEAQPIASGVGG